jgi:hypothetical protein
MLFNFIPSRLILYLHKIVREHIVDVDFDQIFYLHQILENEMEVQCDGTLFVWELQENRRLC